jgi:hypothetical protein
MNASILNMGSLIYANILTVGCPININILSMGHPIDTDILNMGCPIHANILAMGHPTIKWDVPFMQIYWLWDIPLSNEMPHSCKYTSYGISHYPMGCPIHANILAMEYPTIQWDVPFMQIY